MEPLGLEVVCRQMRISDGALCGLKKNLRLARSDLSRKRKAIAKLEIQLFYANRALFALREEIMTHKSTFSLIAGALKQIIIP
jgi:hypothetical protein